MARPPKHSKRVKENLQRARSNRIMKTRRMERTKKFDKLPDAQKRARGIARGKK
tara:strand:- start:338 stop:499 length:162 start_codon:yes stop_codon:yes gene_type:complete